MEDTDFFDTLYQGWSKTTGAENTFWMPEQFEDEAGNLLPWWNIWAVDQSQHKHEVATNLTEDDAGWITALHGCFSDLIRRLHIAVDEAERFNAERDDQEVRIAEVEIERQELQSLLSDTRVQLGNEQDKIEYLEETMRRMDQDLIKANADLVYWRDIAEGIEAQR